MMIPHQTLILYSVIGIILVLLHHRWKHRGEFKRHPQRRWFQYTDINNHETFILLIVGFIIGLLV